MNEQPRLTPEQVRAEIGTCCAVFKNGEAVSAVLMDPSRFRSGPAWLDGSALRMGPPEFKGSDGRWYPVWEEDR